jgi:hypothetical protein
MNKHLDDYLCQTYPKIFVKRKLPRRESCMAEGFSHGNGWFFLLESLCANIQRHINNRNEWVASYGTANDKPVPQVVALQVKEKLGGLRFYYEGGDPTIKGMVTQVQDMSYRICEKCGVMNELVNMNFTGWIRTSCPSCARNEVKEEYLSNRRTELVQLWERVQADISDDETKT